MRVALIAVAAAVAVALFLLLSLNRPGDPGSEPAAAPGSGRPSVAARPPLAEETAEAQEAQAEAEAEIEADADEPAEDEAAPEGAAAGKSLVEHYREVAEEARERVARLPAAGGPARPSSPSRLRPYQPPPEEMGAHLRDRWRKLVGELLYPEGHPRAGQPLDSVTPEQLADAAVEYYEQLAPGGLLDRPVHIVRLQMPFREFNMLRGRVGDGAQLARIVRNTPPDPDAPVYDPYFIPGRLGDPDTSTPRQYYRQESLEEARELFAAAGREG